MSRDASSKTAKNWKQAWHDACALKKPAERREALELLLDAPIEVVFRLARKGRKLISPSLQLPKPDEGGRYFFAAKVRKNVLIDSVQIDIWQTRRRLRIEEILICNDITVSRTPGYHLIRANVLAAAGSVGGHRVVNVSEYLTSDDIPDFRRSFLQSLPRLRQFKYRGSIIRCFWTSRGLYLPTWKKRLMSDDADALQRTLDELSDLVSGNRMTDDVERAAQQVLNPLLIRRMWHDSEEISRTSIRVWNGLNHGNQTSVPLKE